MKVLHTADWHLGQKFYHRTRKEEHQAALKWLADFILQEKIELLIIAGDIFDTDSPPNYARKLYFDFLKRLINSCCQDIIVVAGNHDSANMLEASKELFKLLNVHVVGHITETRQDQIIEIIDPTTQQLKAVVGAVPYLRDRDIRKSIAGESAEERVQNLREGIANHYTEIETALLPYQDKQVPIIVTGHLYTAGGERQDRPNSIHIGTIDIISADNFSRAFDYVALGHLHMVQQIAKPRPIWYSGALIPLDFSEFNYDHAVRLIEFNQREIVKSKSIKVPQIRKIRTYTGSLEKIQEKLSALESTALLKTWIKIEIETPNYSPDLMSDLEELIKDKAAEIITLKQSTLAKRSIDDESYQNLQSLQDLEEIEVFRMCAQQKGAIEKEEMTALEDSFKELLGWMQERDVE